MESNIFIVGEIGVDYTINDALADYQKVRDSEVINLWINSPGGYMDEGLKIVDLFKSSKKLIKTHNLGDIASIAFNIFLVAKRENRYYYPEKGGILIHYPWVEFTGNADEMREVHEELTKQESMLVKQLVNELSVEESVLRGYMGQERFLTVDEIEILNIANIEHENFKAVAKLKSNEMTEKEVKQELSGVKKMLEEIKALFTRTKALMVQDVNGVEIEMPEIETIEQLQAGVTAVIDGSPANGEFVLNTGETLVFENGELTAINEPEGDDVEALKAENERLKQELETLSAKATEKEETIKELEVNAKARLDEVTKQFTEFKNKFSKEFVPDGSSPDPEPKPEIRKPFKNK